MERPIDVQAGGRGGLDALRGRSDSVTALRRRLTRAPVTYLEEALHNPALREEEMVLLLRNRAASTALLARIGRDRRWTDCNEVRKGLVRHPRTPCPVAQLFLGHLDPLDLCTVAEDTHAPPRIRHEAEEILGSRLGALTVGERITLARRASHGVIAALIAGSEDQVLQALLGNARLVERDVVSIASGRETSGQVLRSIVAHPRWGIRHDVRIALARNPRTPVQVALRLIHQLPKQDMCQLTEDAEVPRIVGVGARRRLESGLPMTAG